MSNPVATESLVERIEELGSIAYLVTVRPQGRPHVVSVPVRWDGNELAVPAGRRTSANVAAQPDVTLVWAAPPGRGYCLIVDGTARLPAQPEAEEEQPEPMLLIEPTGAVLHRTPEGDPTAPSCITVLPHP